MLEERRSARAGRPGLRRTASMVTIAALVAGSGGCQSRNAPAPSGAELRIPDQEARDFTLTESSEGKKNWSLWASYAAMYTDRSLVDARTVRIEFFDEKQVRFSTLFADEGIVDQRTNNLEARGNVRILTENGVKMETDSLRWLNAPRKIVSDAFVRVTRKADVVTGYGFESDPNLDHFHIRSGVRAEVRDGDSGEGSARP